MNWISLVKHGVGFFKSYGKLVAGISAVIGLAVSLYQLHDYVYESGRNSMKLEMQDAQREALKQQRDALKADYENQIQVLKADHSDAVRRMREQHRINMETNKVIEYVDREIYVEKSCERLAITISRVLEQSSNFLHVASSGAYASGAVQ